jgi:ELWxxDGT repeat protein
MRFARCLTAAAVLCAVATAARAQQPYLVRDINPFPDSSPGLAPALLRPAGDRLYFFGEDRINGRELWRSGGTPATTSIVGDLQLAGAAFAVDMEAAGTSVYLAHGSFGTGSELWTSDGTVAGTHLVKDLNAGPASSTPRRLAAGNGLVYFVADDASGPGVWQTDGTSGGTVKLSDGEPYSLIPAAGRLFFLIYDDVVGARLWTSDGTAGSGVPLQTVCPAPCFGDGGRLWAAAGGRLYYVADDGAHGDELWRTDGTPGNTVMVADLAPGPADSFFDDMEGVGGTLYFSTRSDQTLWKLEATGTPEALLTGVPNVKSMAASGAGLFFTSGESSGGRLWHTDGSVSGTVPLAQFCNGQCFNFALSIVASSQQAFFPISSPSGAPDRLMASNGTPGGLVELVAGDVTTMAIWQDRLYFGKRDAAIGEELWTSDGTVAGTAPVYDLVNSYSAPYPLVAAGERVFFTAFRPDLGYELWKTQGTEASTTVVDIVSGPDYLVENSLGALGQDAIFTVGGGPGVTTPQLWRSDGTLAGTSLIADVGGNGFFELGGAVLFSGNTTGFSNDELWTSDGTPAGTRLVKDIVPGPDGSIPRPLGKLGNVELLGISVFSEGLWRTDGTTVGTVPVAPIYPTEGAPLGDVIILAASDVNVGRELWRTDGTPAGTTLVADLDPGQSNPRFLTAAESQVFFVADTPAVGPRRLFRTDGTAAGTTAVPGAAEALELSMVAIGNVVYFVGTDDAHGKELWRSDGTAAGTALVKDIVPGPGGSLGPLFGYPDPLVVAGGYVWFSAYSPEGGYELWRSDGTEAGTLQYADIRPGGASSAPVSLFAHGDRLYFLADDGVHDEELWAVDMTLSASAADVVAVEGDVAGATAAFTVRLSSLPIAPVVVTYATANGTAVAGSDYVAQSGALTFLPSGPPQATVAVALIADLHDEDDETFTLQIQSSGPVVVAGPATATIHDDDAPRVAIDSASVPEGDAASSPAVFPVALTTEDGTPTPTAQIVTFATEGITATSGVDFTAADGALTFPAGTVSGTTMVVAVQVTGDVIDEPDETFAVRLQAAGDAVLVTSAGTGHILDDDGIDAGPPTEIAPGSVLRADLTPPAGRTSARDDYALLQQPQASYEVVIDEASGVAAPLTFVRVAGDGTTVLQSGAPVGTGSALSLRWQNTGSAAIADQHLSVSSVACGSTCGAADRYRLRAYETTLSGPRFNNGGGQGTVVLLQNPTDQAIAGRLLLWQPSGVLGFVQPFAVPAHGALAINALALYEGSGSLTLTHDGPYGGLVGKAVALEPATGFSFDTPFTVRAR